MSLFGFNKRPIYRKFDYIPRFYDPVKEEMDDRLKSYKNAEDQSALAKAKIKSGLRTKYRVDGAYQSSVKRASNKKLIVIVLILTLFSIWFLNTKFMQSFLDSFL